MSTLSRKIWITTQFVGIHNYPDAPDEVIYLRVPHRHIFHVKVAIDVFHDDRDLEFILFKQYVESLIKGGNMSFKSCEMIACELIDTISLRYPERSITVNVSEDNENGCELTLNV